MTTEEIEQELAKSESLKECPEEFITEIAERLYRLGRFFC